MHLAFEKGFN